MMPSMADLRSLTGRSDWLLTALTALLTLMIFVFAPLQAIGISVFYGFALGGLMAIIVSMLFISGSPAALVLMSIALVANVAVLLLRLHYPLTLLHLYVLAAAWLIIALTLGNVIVQAVFKRGRVTYHRIIGAILVYELVAVAFAALFVFVGLIFPGAISGMSFDDDRSLASAVFYLSFGTLTSTGYGDIVPVHPLARSLCNIESVIGQLYPATLLARLVTLELRGHGR